MKILSYRRFALWWQLAMDWLDAKFASINVDLTPVEEKVDEVKSDVADVKTAVEGIDFSGLATESNATSNKEAIINAMAGISVDTSNLATKAVEQWLGLEESYEAEAKGGERTNNTVIDECKVRFQDAFNGLLPTGFTMPNSVTVDNLTYTGTTNS